MASNGLNSKALKGKCRICQRVRCTLKHVSPVGEVHHGFATGHVWECNDSEECDSAALKKLSARDTTGVTHARIKNALEQGRLKVYVYLT